MTDPGIPSSESADLELRRKSWARGQFTQRNAPQPTDPGVNALQEIAREDWLPSESSHQAIHALGNWKAPSNLSPCPDWYQVSQAEDHRHELADFTRDFFSFEPAERLRRWQALAEKVQGNVRSEAWMQHLAKGLTWNSVDPEIQQDGSLEDQLRQSIQKAFLLPPPARGPEIARFVGGKLSSTESRLALIGYLEGSPQWQEMVPELASVLLQNRFDRTLVISPRERKRKTATTKRQWREPEQTESQGSSWLIIVPMILVGSMLLRALSGGLSPSSNSAFTSNYNQSKKILDEINSSPRFYIEVDNTVFSKRSYRYPLQSLGVNEKGRNIYPGEATMMLAGSLRVIVVKSFHLSIRLTEEDRLRLVEQVDREFTELRKRKDSSNSMILTIPDPDLVAYDYWPKLAKQTNDFARIDRQQRELIAPLLGTDPCKLFLLPPDTESTDATFPASGPPSP